MTNEPTISDTISSWEPCSSGTLTNVSRQHRSAVARRKIMSVAGIGAAAFAFLAVGMFIRSKSGDSPMPIVGLSCSAVIAYTDSFFSQELSSAEEQQVVLHLGHCASCRQQYQQRAQELKLSDELKAMLSSDSAVNVIRRSMANNLVSNYMSSIGYLSLVR